MLAGAQNMGIDLQADEYGRYLGLYKYDDGNTCYEKKIHFMQIWDSFVLRSMEIITLTEFIH